jgi:hypothetical protein
MRALQANCRFQPTHSTGPSSYALATHQGKEKIMRALTILTTVATACGVAAGCASEGPQATEAQLTRAGTLIEQAEKAQAQRYAAPDLQRARDELRAAEVANSKGSYDAARSDAESAAADADLAAARASAGEALRAAHEASQGNSVLQQETEHGAVGSSGIPSTPTSDLEPYPPAAPAPAAPPPDTSSPEP